MSYTLAKWALWLVAAAAIGCVAGWMLRGLKTPKRATEGPAPRKEDADQMASTARNELEQVERERARLRIELDECRATAAALRSAAASAAAAGVAGGSAVRSAPPTEDASERARLAAMVGDREATIGDLRARLWNQEAKIGELESLLAAHIAASAPPEPDLVAGEAALGEKVRFNDLTVIEGIGPKIADLLHANGHIRTWWELHHTDVAILRRLIDEAGSSTQLHDPSSWPQQAGLLARGQWHEFAALVDRLRGGTRGQ